MVFLKIPRPRLKIPCPFLGNFWYDKFMAKIIYINEIPVTIEYRRVKNINLYLKPPEGQVLVTAPRQVPVSRIRTFVEEKERWIRKHQERMQAVAVNREAEPELTRAQRKVLQEKVEFYAKKWEPRMESTCLRVDPSEDEDPLGKLYSGHRQDPDQYKALLFSG